jgi:hypothetical protein
VVRDYILHEETAQPEAFQPYLGLKLPLNTIVIAPTAIIKSHLDRNRYFTT